jgi:hypothetical protein
VLETGPGRGLEQAGDLIQREHPQQLPRIVGEGQLMGEVGAASGPRRRRPTAPLQVKAESDPSH